MSFKIIENGFVHKCINNQECSINQSNIKKVYSYTQDQITIDEHRLVFEMTDGKEYIFSEEESGWELLLNWVKDLANLDENWYSKSYPQAFSNKVNILWANNF